MNDFADYAKEIVEQCSFQDYALKVKESSTGAVYLQASYYEADVISGEIEKQHTRRWNLTPKMTKSEIVATAFKCSITSMEHRTREWFKYRGKPIYHPHYDVDDLYKICEQRDVRKLVEV